MLDNRPPTTGDHPHVDTRCPGQIDAGVRADRQYRRLGLGEFGCPRNEAALPMRLTIPRMLDRQRIWPSIDRKAAKLLLPRHHLRREHRSPLVEAVR